MARSRPTRSAPPPPDSDILSNIPSSRHPHAVALIVAYASTVVIAVSWLAMTFLALSPNVNGINATAANLETLSTFQIGFPTMSRDTLADSTPLFTPPHPGHTPRSDTIPALELMGPIRYPPENVYRLLFLDVFIICAFIALRTPRAHPFSVRHDAFEPAVAQLTRIPRKARDTASSVYWFYYIFYQIIFHVSYKRLSTACRIALATPRLLAHKLLSRTLVHSNARPPPWLSPTVQLVMSESSRTPKEYGSDEKWDGQPGEGQDVWEALMQLATSPDRFTMDTLLNTYTADTVASGYVAPAEQLKQSKEASRFILKTIDPELIPEILRHCPIATSNTPAADIYAHLTGKTGATSAEIKAVTEHDAICALFDFQLEISETDTELQAVKKWEKVPADLKRAGCTAFLDSAPACCKACVERLYLAQVQRCIADDTYIATS